MLTLIRLNLMGEKDNDFVLHADANRFEVVETSRLGRHMGFE